MANALESVTMPLGINANENMALSVLITDMVGMTTFLERSGGGVHAYAEHGKADGRGGARAAGDSVNRDIAHERCYLA